MYEFATDVGMIQNGELTDVKMHDGERGRERRQFFASYRFFPSRFCVSASQLNPIHPTPPFQ